MDTKNLVSIIVRTKNRNLLLQRALNGIINQTYKSWEVIIVNDGGDKKSLELLLTKIQKTKIKIIHNKISKGRSAAANQGIRATLGEFIVLHDDDDTWKPTFLEEVIHFFHKNQDKKIYGVTVLCNIIHEIIKNSHVYTIRNVLFKKYHTNLINLFDMLKSNQVFVIGFVYRREVIKKIGYYDESLPVVEDWDFNIRFLMHYDIHVLPHVLVNYHQRIISDFSNAFNNNTIQTGIKEHFFYDTLIRNKYLREDIVTHNLGLGFLLNISQEFNHLHSSTRILAIFKEYLLKLHPKTLFFKLKSKFIQTVLIKCKLFKD